MKKINLIQAVFFLAGLGLFAGVLREAGVREEFAVLWPIFTGPGALILAAYPLISALDVWGWQIVFPASARPRIHFRGLFFIRLAGEALNSVTPFVDVGGEFLKVSLVGKVFGVDKKAALTSVLMGRTALFFSEIFFWITGIVLIFIFFPVPPVWRAIFLVTVSLCAVLGIAILAMQKKGFFLTFLRWLELLRFDSKLFGRFHVSLKTVDDEITRFYSGRDTRLLVTLSLHFGGWVAGGVETFVMCRLLGMEVSLLDGIILEALLQLVRTASFFIPGNLGAQEAGLALFVGWMGGTPFLGVAVSLLKRIRQLVWTAVGFFVWGIFQWRGFRGGRSAAG